MQTFKELGLSEEILKALGEIGFETPTEIQASAIPKLLNGDPDMIGLAQTGTGKTAAFSLPLLDTISANDRTTKSVILAPTRELAQQIANEIENFSKYKTKLNISVVYGGTSISNQIREIKRNTPHIIIATPGRLIDLIGRRIVDLSNISHLILDEADEMLNMGFQEDIDKILIGTPEEKAIWLFSATMPPEIRNIVDTYMEDPVEVSVDRKNVTNQNISHKYVLVHRRDKAEAVQRIIDYIPEFYGVIFCRTKMDTQELADVLTSQGYRAEALHGDLSQGQRDAVMNKFRSSAINILVATDVAARGIDVNNLTHVIHYTLPDTPAYYTHRSGRTARAGKSGVSLTILIPKDKSKMNRIARSLKIDFEKVMLPIYADLVNKRIEQWCEKIVGVDETELPVGMLDHVKDFFVDIDKETLIEKLLSLQIRKFTKKKGITEDLNLDEGSRRDKKSKKHRKGRDDERGDRRDGRRDNRSSGRREGRRERSDEDQSRSRGKRETQRGKTQRMFVNIGKVDKFSVGELVDFLSKNGNIKRRSIGDIKMNKMHSIFEIDRSEVTTLKKHFGNIHIKGRHIRCNPE